MKIYAAAVLLLLSQQQPVAGFLQPLPAQHGNAQRHATLGMGAETTADVSIPYDAAARLAYDEWRAEFNKGDFDADRFQIFKDNYEIVTVANMKAKKKARDEGTVSISLMSLNEFGDMTQDEYLGAQQQQGDPSIAAPQPTKTSDILGKAVAAAELQTEASTALEEAFDALAVEEQKLVETLGLESVDELEEALDSLEGIAPDGGELETSTLAREARIRDAYLNWCKEFDKEIDESRFPAFSQNFLFMEQYTKTTGKEMALNKYADYSKDEYEAAMKSEKSTTSESPPKPESPAAPTKAETVVKDPVPPKIDPPTPEPKVESKPVEAKAPEEKKPVSPAPATVAVPKVSSSAPASVPAKASSPSSGPLLNSEELVGAAKGVTESLGGVLGKAAEFAKNANKNIKKSIDEGLKEIEDAAETPEARQARLERLAKEQQEIAEAAAVARAERAKAIQEKAKREQAKRQQIEKERSERLKQSEKEAAKAQASAEAAAIAAAKAEEERQATIAAQRAYFEAQAAEEARKKAREFDTMQRKRQPQPSTQKKTKSTSPNSVFANILSKVEKPETSPQKPPPSKKAPIKKPPAKKNVSKAPAFSLFSDLAKKSSKPVPSQPPPIPPKSVPVPKIESSAKPSTTFSLFPPAQPKKAAPAVKVAPAPKVNTPQPRPTLSLFAPSTPKPKPNPLTPSPAKAAPAFSFFDALSNKDSPKTKKDPKKVQSSPTLSLFAGSKKPPVKDVAPAPKPSPAPAFSFFKPPPAKKAPEPAPAPAKPASTAFSLFGGPPKTTKEPQPKIPNRSGTISLFGAGKKMAAKKPDVEEVPTKGKPAFSLFGSAPKQAKSPAPAKKAPPKNVPVLSRWKQNPDGSITGRVSNSPNFRPNTEITTSPVKKGAKAGSLVKTGSGSQYYLS